MSDKEEFHLEIDQEEFKRHCEEIDQQVDQVMNAIKPFIDVQDESGVKLVLDGFKAMSFIEEGGTGMKK